MAYKRNTTEIDYQSLYNKCRNYGSVDFGKLVRYIKEVRMKNKKQ